MPVALLVHCASLADGSGKAPFGGPYVVAMLAGQQAAREWVIRNHRELFFACERQQFALDLAKEQVIARLHRNEAHHAQHV